MNLFGSKSLMNLTCEQAEFYWEEFFTSARDILGKYG
jgi:hypothetical protein